MSYLLGRQLVVQVEPSVSVLERHLPLRHVRRWKDSFYFIFFLTLQHQWDVTLNTRCCCCWSGTPANAHAKHTSQSRRSPAATRNEQITDCGLNSCQGWCSADCCRLNDDELSIYVCFPFPLEIGARKQRARVFRLRLFSSSLLLRYRSLVGTRVHYRHRLASVILQRK